MQPAWLERFSSGSAPRNDRIRRIWQPERSSQIGLSVGGADRAIREFASTVEHLDTTHFDTVRFPPPEWALDTFVDAARDGSLAYTEYRGSHLVRESVADSATRLTGAPVDASQVVITPGTQAGIFTSIAALVEPGAPVALVDPDYLFNARITRFLDSPISWVRMRRESGDGAVLDLDDLEHAFRDGARTLVFSNPNNPTGALYSRATLAGIAELVARFDAQVVVDSLYARLIYDGQEMVHLRSLPGLSDRCTTLLGPSKTESLSGYRIGVVIAPARAARDFEDTLSVLSLRAPAYAQNLLTKWLHVDNEWVADRVDQLAKIRDNTLGRLRELEWLDVSAPQGTAYVFPDVSRLGLPDQEVAKRLIAEAGVLVSPGYQFGPSGVGSFRLCFARDETQWDEALVRMVSVLHSLEAQIR